jgi:hypothetical protein
MNRSVHLLVVAAALVAAGCQSGNTEGSERSAGFPAPEMEVVVNSARMALITEGFTPDLENSQPEKGMLTTRHMVSLQPFGGLGYLDKATVWVKEVPNRPNFFMVETNVIREINRDQDNPSNPIAADWGDEERVPDLERLISMRVERDFVGSDVSPKFRERYGMPAAPETRIENPVVKETRPPNRPR